jgi:hypothetical protein
MCASARAVTSLQLRLGSGPHHRPPMARRRGHRPGHRDQVPATHNERRRGQWPGHHDQVTRESKRARGKQLGQGPCTKKLGTSPSESPCSVAAFVVNSEPHTGTRPSVRLCVGLELARCVHRGLLFGLRCSDMNVGNGLGTTIYYLRRTTSGAAESSLGNNTKYLRRTQRGASRAAAWA